MTTLGPIEKTKRSFLKMRKKYLMLKGRMPIITITYFSSQVIGCTNFNGGLIRYEIAQRESFLVCTLIKNTWHLGHSAVMPYEYIHLSLDSFPQNMESLLHYSWLAGHCHLRIIFRYLVKRTACFVYYQITDLPQCRALLAKVNV